MAGRLGGTRDLELNTRYHEAWGTGPLSGPFGGGEGETWTPAPPALPQAPPNPIHQTTTTTEDLQQSANSSPRTVLFAPLPARGLPPTRPGSLHGCSRSAVECGSFSARAHAPVPPVGCWHLPTPLPASSSSPPQPELPPSSVLLDLSISLRLLLSRCSLLPHTLVQPGGPRGTVDSCLAVRNGAHHAASYIVNPHAARNLTVSPPAPVVSKQPPPPPPSSLSVTGRFAMVWHRGYGPT